MLPSRRSFDSPSQSYRGMIPEILFIARIPLSWVAIVTWTLTLLLAQSAFGQGKVGLKAPNDKWVSSGSDFSDKSPLFLAVSGSGGDVFGFVPIGDGLVRLEYGNVKQLIRIDAGGVVRPGNQDTAQAAVFKIVYDTAYRFSLRTLEGRCVSLSRDKIPHLRLMSGESTCAWFVIEPYSRETPRDIIAALSPTARLEIARDLARKGDIKDATRYFERITDDGTLTTDDSMIVSRLLLQSGPPFDITRVARARRLSVRVFDSIVAARALERNYTAVEELLRGSDPTGISVRSISHYADALLHRTRDTAQAIRLLQEAISRSSGDTLGVYLLAEVLAARGSDSALVALLRNPMLPRPLPPNLHRNLAYSYRQIHDERQAIVNLSELVSTDSSDLWSYGHLMLALDADKRLPEAVSVARASVAHETRSTPAWVIGISRWILAQCALDAKRYPDGLKFVDEGLAVDADNADLYAVRGNLLAASGNGNDACMAYARVLELDSAYSIDRLDAWKRLGCAKSIAASASKKQREESVRAKKQIDADLAAATLHVQTIERHIERWKRGVLSAQQDVAETAGRNEEVWSRLKSSRAMTGEQQGRYRDLMERLEIAMRTAQTLAR